MASAATVDRAELLQRVIYLYADAGALEVPGVDEIEVPVNFAPE